MFVFGIGFLLQIFFFAFAEAAEGFESAVDGSGEADFVAVEQGEGWGVVAEGFEGEGGASGFVNEFELLIDTGALPGRFEIEEGGFEGPDALEAPAGDDDLVDQVGLELVGRDELVDVGLAEAFESLSGFVLEDDDAGAESVGDGVAGRPGASFGCFGPAGLGSIGAGGLDFPW